MLMGNNPFCFVNFNTTIEFECLNENIINVVKQSINHVQSNYFVKLPCKECDSTKYNILTSYVDNKINNKHVYQSVFINTKVTESIKLFNKLQNKNIVFVMLNTESNIQDLPFDLQKIFFVDKKKPIIEEYNRLKNEWKYFEKNTIILFSSVGVIGNMLCYEWYKNNSEISCLYLDDFFDPYIKNKFSLYHQGLTPLCELCNSCHLTELPFSIEKYDNAKKLQYIDIKSNLPPLLSVIHAISCTKQSEDEIKIKGYLKLISSSENIDF